MMTELQKMWNACLEHLTAAKHREELNNPGGKPMPCALYHAGPKSGAVKRAEIDRMLKLEAIEPTKTELAAIIVFAPKKDRTLQFMSIIAVLLQLLSGNLASFLKWTSA